MGAISKGVPLKMTDKRAHDQQAGLLDYNLILKERARPAVIRML